MLEIRREAGALDGTQWHAAGAPSGYMTDPVSDAALTGAAFVRHLPQGLETLMEEGGKNLSAGQRQLLSFARALVGDPRILILDDSLSAVDTYTEEEILARLRGGPARGRHTHDPQPFRAHPLGQPLDHEERRRAGAKAKPHPVLNKLDRLVGGSLLGQISRRKSGSHAALRGNWRWLPRL